MREPSAEIWERSGGPGRRGLHRLIALAPSVRDRITLPKRLFPAGPVTAGGG